MVLGNSVTMFLFSFYTKVSLEKKQLMKTYKGIEVIFYSKLLMMIAEKEEKKRGEVE